MLKGPLQYVNYQKFSKGACPRIPLEPFSFSICFKVVPHKEKLAEKYGKFGGHLPEKISWIHRRYENTFKGVFASLLGLTCLYLVNIQPDSIFHSPHQNFLNSLLSARSSFFFVDPPLLKFAGCAPI